MSVAGHSLRRALTLVSIVCASLNSRTMTAAVSGKRRGAHTVGLAGQRTMITAGISFASTSSTTIASVVLMLALASTVTGDDGDTAELAFRLGPGLRS
jgi:hypothetical protein